MSARTPQYHVFLLSSRTCSNVSSLQMTYVKLIGQLSLYTVYGDMILNHRSEFYVTHLYRSRCPGDDLAQKVLVKLDLTRPKTSMKNMSLPNSLKITSLPTATLSSIIIYLFMRSYLTSFHGKCYVALEFTLYYDFRKFGFPTNFHRWM